MLQGRECKHQDHMHSLAWTGRSGIGLVKRNDINFPSRAAKKTFPKQPNTSPPGTPRSSEHQASRVSWFGMEDAQSATPGDAWQSWMDQSADLSEFGMHAHVTTRDSNLTARIEYIENKNWAYGIKCLHTNGCSDAMCCEYRFR